MRCSHFFRLHSERGEGKSKINYSYRKRTVNYYSNIFQLLFMIFFHGVAGGGGSVQTYYKTYFDVVGRRTSSS